MNSHNTNAQKELFSYFKKYRIKKDSISDEQAEIFQEDIYKYTIIRVRTEILKEIIAETPFIDISIQELNAIAIYCGYTDYSDYENCFAEGKSPKHISKKIWIPGILLILLFVASYFLVRIFLYMTNN